MCDVPSKVWKCWSSPLLLVCEVGVMQDASTLGRICQYHVRILDPKRKIIVLLHPYLENYVVLPTRSTIRVSANQQRSEANRCMKEGMRGMTRWCSVAWVNGLAEKHTWLSAGLSGMQMLQRPHGLT